LKGFGHLTVFFVYIDLSRDLPMKKKFLALPIHHDSQAPILLALIYKEK